MCILKQMEVGDITLFLEEEGADYTPRCGPLRYSVWMYWAAEDPRPNAVGFPPTKSRRAAGRLYGDMAASLKASHLSLLGPFGA